ncbi:hypothetical protein RclHR1_06030004 [Rhizophagus clarus]|uniref:Uncharacterized protein n=1 Tax=Rhizophagus clarus TaxID=94130 RepID=A0A2Z6RR09_9GLOM|nr:hypothetical protein RclHR1_06030004 [Rhizophagus clarus]GES83298.1 conserved hypothetical protein [Rhizophagus clarus]
MLPCKANNVVRDNRKWYSPNWTEKGEFTFCEECYHKFIKDTSLSVYIRKDGEFEACSYDFKPSVRQQWSLAVNKNDIGQFKKYVDYKIYEIKFLKAQMDTELARQSMLISQKGEVICLSAVSDDYGYDVESRQIDVELSRSMDIYSSYCKKMNELCLWN